MSIKDGFFIDVILLICIYFGMIQNLPIIENAILVVMWVFSILGIMSCTQDLDPEKFIYPPKIGLLVDAVFFLFIAYSGHVGLSGFYLLAALLNFHNKLKALEAL